LSIEIDGIKRGVTKSFSGHTLLHWGKLAFSMDGIVFFFFGNLLG
jgi:hypothetical protein